MKTKEDIYKIVEDACFWGIPKRLKSYILDAMELYAKEVLEQLGEETDWNKLREQYFEECTYNRSTLGGLSRVGMAPHDLFEWFKKRLSNPIKEPKDSGWISVEDIGPFAKWREDNRWFSFEDGKWKYTFEHGTAISNKSYEKNYTKTTAELFQMYRDSIIAAGLPPTVETKKD